MGSRQVDPPHPSLKDPPHTLASITVTHPPSLQKREEFIPLIIRMKTAMMSLCFLLLTLTISTTISTSTEDKRNLLSCSADQLISCVAEIEKAFEDCSHLNSTDEIMVCINDILAATNCQACLRDVLPFLC